MRSGNRKSQDGIGNQAKCILLRINTRPFTKYLDAEEKVYLFKNRHKFKELIRAIILEFELQETITQLTVHIEDRGAEIGPESVDGWHLYMYGDNKNYMNERLIRHEFGHVADLLNPRMGGREFATRIIEKWEKGSHFWALNLAMNISLDSRLAERGSGETFRRANFHNEVENSDENFFDEAWAMPPMTWQDIESLAVQILSRGRRTSGFGNLAGL